jgi:hypothetical protein
MSTLQQLEHKKKHLSQQLKDVERQVGSGRTRGGGGRTRGRSSSSNSRGRCDKLCGCHLDVGAAAAADKPSCKTTQERRTAGERSRAVFLRGQWGGGVVTVG